MCYDLRAADIVTYGYGTLDWPENTFAESRPVHVSLKGVAAYAFYSTVSFTADVEDQTRQNSLTVECSLLCKFPLSVWQVTLSSRPR